MLKRFKKLSKKTVPMWVVWIFLGIGVIIGFVAKLYGIR